MRVIFQVRTILQCFLVVSALLLSACASIPHDYPRKASFALQHTQKTMLGKEISSELKTHPGQSGFMPLIEGIDALAARLGLAMFAEKSLDLQYYIWRGDTTGVALGAALLEAAERGVRIRLLLDDLQASVHDPVLLALDKHPHIEVRMFNPTASRGIKAFELLSRFSQLNRRMHNKCFIADNQMAIVGGRNIGDEYFSASPEVDFTDFDVLTVGPVVPEVSSIFDMYWNSSLAVPISILYRENANAAAELAKVRESLDQGLQKLEHSRYAQALHNSQFVKDIKKSQGRFYWGEAKAVADSPNKFQTSPEDDSSHMGPQLLPIMDNIHSELFIISPYFVPGDGLVRYFSGLTKRNVKVTIITNSLASNDVGMVHAGYAKYREVLLAAGVNLYEYKPDPEKIKMRKKRGSGFPGSSRASLHAKVFVIDRKQTFVGSLNVDPRSIKLNSELGVVFENTDFASGLVNKVESELAENSYHLRLVEQGDEVDVSTQKQLTWETMEDGKPVTYTSEPNVGFFRLFGIWFMSLFVSEELL